VPAALTGRVGEVGRQVDVRGAGDVSRQVGRVTVGAPELPADVEHGDLGQQRAELLGSDQGAHVVQSANPADPA
jgi:hypothetical protein